MRPIPRMLRHLHVLQTDEKSLSNNASVIKRLQKYLKALSSHEEIHSAEVISLENHALVSSEYGYLSDWDQAPDTTWVPWIRDIQRKPLLIKRRWYGTNHEHGTVELLSLARPVVKDGQSSARCWSIWITTAFSPSCIFIYPTRNMCTIWSR